MIKYIIFLFVFTSIYSQQEYNFTINTRNAKIDTVYDYYFKLGAKIQYNKYTYEGFINIERDNAIYYHSCKVKVSQKKFKAEYYKDTEQKIEYISGNYNLIRAKYIKIGIDGTYSDNLSLSIYTGLEYKFFKCELIFLDKINRLTLNINPDYKINENLSIGIDGNLIYIDNKTKWNTGIKLKYLI